MIGAGTASAAETTCAIGDAAHLRAHPLSQFGFDALVAGAARPRPGALALVDHHDGTRDEISYADLYQRVGAFVARLRDAGLTPGERALICCPAGAQSFVAATAVAAAGLEPVLAPTPLPMTRRALQSAAGALKPAALFGPARFCGLGCEEALLSLAFETPSIRLLGSLGGPLDGAADFSRDMLQAPRAARARLAEDWSDEKRARIGALDECGAAFFASQGALLAAALDLVRLTRAVGEAPVLSLCAPSSLAGLVAGPLAALLAGARLHFLAPVDSTRLLDMLDALAPVRLVAPALLLPDLASAGLLTNGALLSVVALRRGATDSAPLEHVGGCAIVEIAQFNDALEIRFGEKRAAYATSVVES